MQFFNQQESQESLLLYSTLRLEGKFYIPLSSLLPFQFSKQFLTCLKCKSTILLIALKLAIDKVLAQIVLRTTLLAANSSGSPWKRIRPSNSK